MRLITIFAIGLTLTACTQTGGPIATPPPDTPAADRRAASPFDQLATIFPPGPAGDDGGLSLTLAGPGPVFTSGSQVVVGHPAFVFDGENLWWNSGRFFTNADRDGNVIRTYRSSRTQASLQVAGGFLWILDTTGELWKMGLDGESFLRILVSEPTAMTAGEDGVWVYSESRGVVTRFDLAGEQVSEFSLADHPAWLEYAAGSLWLWVGDSVVRVSLDGEELDRWPAPAPRIDLASSFSRSPFAHAGPDLWVGGYSYSEVTRITPGTGEVQKISLPLGDGERESGQFMGQSLAFDGERVWVAYRVLSGPVNEQTGLIAVFDRDGEVEGVIRLQHCCPTVVRVGEEVWVSEAFDARGDLYRKLPVDYAVGANE